MSTNSSTTRPSPLPSPGVPGEGASGRALADGALTLLREWQAVCDSIARGETSLLIRKGGIAEGRAGFELKQRFFGLLPTLFHQVKNADPSAVVPEPPRVVSTICELVAAYVVPSAADLSSLVGSHAYTSDQLAARQAYKAERPLHLIVVRPFRLRASLSLGEGAVKASCKSWVEVPLDRPLGGIEAVGDGRSIDALRATIERFSDATRITQ